MDWNSEQFRLLLEGVADYAIFLLDDKGQVSRWSKSAEKLFGFTAKEIEGQHFSRFYPASDIESKKPINEIKLASAHGRFEDTSYRIRSDGSLFWADSVMCPLWEKEVLRGYSLIIRDISERKKNEDILRQKDLELSQARKLEAIGRLAGGVAHDFNNFMTGIIGLTEDLHQSMASGDPRRDDLVEILKTADKARILTRELLAFGRQQTSSPVVVNLNVLIQEKQKILKSMLGADIELIMTLDPSIRTIQIDPLQMDQVLVNVIMNARDAMPNGGRITIETSRLQVEKNAFSEIEPGPYAVLRISDTGSGMQPHVLAHLFEPFFTTKGVGQGTGLGLATVYGIVKQNQGDISVQSQPGKGTSFQILLPHIDSPIAIESPAPERVSATPFSGSETILVAEDEDIVRRVATRALEKHGYRVLATASGKQALEVGRQFTSPIHLLVTDIVMPGINGRALAAQFCTLHPESAVLYMSAHAEKVIQERGILESGLAFIEKPFTSESFAQKVATVLKNSRQPCY